jgi:DNA primase catalytic core
MTYEKIVESCRFLLNNYPGAQASKSYLDSRLSPESQEKWGFGHFPNLQDISILTDLVGEESLLKKGLLNSGFIEDSLSPRRVIKNFFEQHPLVVPQRDAYGKVVALIGRTLLSEVDRQANKLIKYKNTVFKKGMHLFGLYENKQAILDEGFVFIVEGQIDVIKAGEIGLKNVVGIGNSSMTSYQFSVITRYTNNIHLLLDNDEAGQKGRKRIVSKFGQLANIQDFYIPEDYKDIDEYITNGRISEYADLSFLVHD